MARTILVAGTASHVGKSTVAAGLCRYLADRGVDVAPFKAQNMSNNARVVPRADAAAADEASASDPWGEVGVSQYVQARAARIRPTTDVNPVLLKPRGDGESQVVLDGRAVAHVPAGAYYDSYWERARETARDAHARLADGRDVVVAEGAGSIAEINLHDRDLANVETARFADATILLVADVDRGGAFAALAGTIELVPDDVRERIAGCVITKFRGDRSILAPGTAEFEDRTGVPVLGVLPHDDPGLPEEDSVALPSPGERAVRGADDGVPDERAVTVAVPRLPRLSNATDLAPLARTPGVRVAVVPLADPLADADAVLLPGTKNTVDDLLALREAGLHERLRAFEGPIVGLCGGYQLLGEVVTEASLEGTGERPGATGVDEAGSGDGSGDSAASGDDRVPGVGLLPVATRFEPEKTVAAVTRRLSGVGPLAGASGEVSGYEIHAGETELLDGADARAVERPFPDAGAATERVLGTYLHGLFENESAREAFVEAAFDAAGTERPAGTGAGRGDGGRDGNGDRSDGQRDPADRAAALIADHVDLDVLGLP